MEIPYFYIHVESYVWQKDHYIHQFFARYSCTSCCTGRHDKSIFILPELRASPYKNSTFSHPQYSTGSEQNKMSAAATTHNRRTINFFSKKEGLLFFADRPPGSSYRPRRVESKGSAGISRQPITLRFVGYPTFPVGRAGEAQRQSRRNTVGAKAG